MNARSIDSITQRRQEEKTYDYPDALYQELDTFCPSPAFRQLNGLLSTTPVDLKELGDAAQDDTSLAGEAIRLCNSSLFSLARPISTLEQAVVATDAELVRALLLTCWLTKLTGQRVATQENQMFWNHSLLVARLSQRINDWVGLAQPEQAFLAGLLHDVGFLPFLTLLSSVETKDKQSLYDKFGESVDSQRRLFKTDHCELGQKLCTILDFPLPLAEVASGHHRREATVSGFPLLAVVGCAEAVSQFCSLCVKRELPKEAVGAFVKDAFRVWLPTLKPSAGFALLTSLKTELLGTVGGYEQNAKRDSHDSLSGAGVQDFAQGGANSGG